MTTSKKNSTSTKQKSQKNHSSQKTKNYNYKRGAQERNACCKHDCNSKDYSYCIYKEYPDLSGFKIARSLGYGERFVVLYQRYRLNNKLSHKEALEYTLKNWNE